MTAIRVPLTGFEEYIDEDRPALYLTPGEGNLPGVQEVHLTFVEPNGVNFEGPRQVDEINLGWISVERLRDALNALPITPTRRITS